MKILIATPLFPPQTGGPATDSALLAKELPRHGIEVFVVPFSEVGHLPPGVRHAAYAFKLWRAARGVRVIVAMDTLSVCVPAACVCLLARKQLVVRVPGDFAWEQAVQRFDVKDSIEEFQHTRYGWRVELMRSLQHWAVRRAVLVVTISDFIQSIVVQWGVEPQKMKRIYLSINFDERPVMPERVPAGKILFSLGRFVPWKGFGMLVELMPRLPKEWHLVLAGDGPLRGALEARVKGLNLESRVTFLGALPRQEALGWYRRADVFVLNTSFESFSFQILEAMNAGAPIIATTAGSIPELLESSTEGVLCAPNDAEAFLAAIQSTQDEPYLWKSRREAAQAKARRFSTQRSVDDFAAELKKLCA
jgi:glycosyltransferase involved in cell wall biosynthesis